MYSKKYHSSAVQGNTPERSSSIITNDLFMATFFLTTGCTLDHIETNGRKRVSFVFIGERLHELRDAYRKGPVQLDIQSFRDNLHKIRQEMDAILNNKQRSVSHAISSTLTAQP
jgi:diphthamide synthase subunit DPH2